MIAKTFNACLLAALVLLPLGGCMLDDSKMVDPMFKLPEKARILVWVDPRETANMPIDAPPALGKAIADDLYQHKVADSFVAQSRLTDLRRDPRYSKFGVADVAKLVDADIVIYVDTLNFNIESLSAGQLTEGAAQATVKVIDKDGKRLWPETLSALGFPVQARINVGLADEQSSNHVRDKLIGEMSEDVGKLFHRWDAGGSKMDHSRKVSE